MIVIANFARRRACVSLKVNANEEAIGLRSVSAEQWTETRDPGFELTSTDVAALGDTMATRWRNAYIRADCP